MNINIKSTKLLFFVLLLTILLFECTNLNKAKEKQVDTWLKRMNGQNKPELIALNWHDRKLYFTLLDSASRVIILECLAFNEKAEYNASLLLKDSTKAISNIEIGKVYEGYSCTSNLKTFSGRVQFSISLVTTKMHCLIEINIHNDKMYIEKCIGAKVVASNI